MAIRSEIIVEDQGTAVVEKHAQASSAAFDKVGRSASNASSRFDAFSRGASRAFDQSINAANRFFGVIRGVTGSIFNLRNAVLGAGIGLLGKEIFQTSNEVTGLRLALNAAGGGAEEGGRAFDFVRQKSDELGLSLTGSVKGYKGILAATQAAGKESSVAERIFSGVSVAVRSLNLSNEQASRTFTALSQIMGKNSVQLEELKGQLGDSIPGAVAIMADALDVSVEKLFDMTKQGEVSSDALIPFADKLAERFGSQLPAAMRLATADMQRLKNEAVLTAEAFGQGGFNQGIQRITVALRNMLQEARRTGAIDALSQAVGGLAGEFADFVEKEGKGMIASLNSLANVMKDTLVPVFKTLQTTSKQVFSALAVSFIQARISALDLSDAVLGVRNSFSIVLDTISNIVPGFGLLLNANRLLNKEAEKSVEENAKLRKELIKTRDTHQQYLNNAAAGQIQLSNNIKLTTEEQQRQAQETSRLEGIAKALGDTYKVVGGDIVRVANEAGKAIDKNLKGATEGAAKEVDKLAAAYENLDIESTKALKDSAAEAVDAFKEIRAAGNETEERLSKIFDDVAEKVIEAHGKVPNEYRLLFREMELISGESFDRIGKQSENAATRVGNSMSGALGSIADVSDALARIDSGGGAIDRIEGRSGGRSGGGGGRSGSGSGGPGGAGQREQDLFTLGGRGGREISRRLNANAESVDRFAGAFAGSTFRYAETLTGLERQLQDVTRRLNDPLGALGAQLAGVPGNIEAFQDSLRGLQGEIQSRINEFRAQREADRLAEIEANRPFDAGQVLDRTGAVPLGAGGGGPQSSAGPAGGSSGILPGRGASDDSLIIGNDRPLTQEEGSALDFIQENEDRIPGLSGVLVGTRRGSGEQRNVTLENPQFQVNINGVNADAIDGESVAVAIAPNLEEAIRLGELELDSKDKIVTR